MAIRQAVQLFALALAGATLAGCVQHTVTERSASLGVSPQATAQAPPQRRASVAHHRRVAAASRKHTPFAARLAAAKPAAMTDGSIGIASFYKYESKTASGEQFNPGARTAAHRTLPFGTRLRVTNVATGQSVTVRINDRGPFIANRILDVTPRAAKKLGFEGDGLTTTRIEVLSVGDGSYKRKKRGWFFF